MNTLINHWDLDGVVSSIMLHQGMKFQQTFKGGYKRFDGFIDKIKEGSNVVVADCCFTVEQFTRLKDKANNIIYIDHHPDSILIKETFTNDLVIFDQSKAASLLCLDFIQKKKQLSKPFRMLAKAGNHYDLFDRESEPDWFAFGYDLNILFWEYHYDKFFNRFKNGFRGFLKEEKEFIKASKIKRDKAIADSTYITLEGAPKGLVCLPKENSIQNDIPDSVKGFDVYYIIMRYPKSTSVSVRSKEIDLTDYLNDAEYHYSVQSAGGHPQAGGINFRGNPSDEELVNVINDCHNRMQPHGADYDIPF